MAPRLPHKRKCIQCNLELVACAMAEALKLVKKSLTVSPEKSNVCLVSVDML